MCVTCSVFGGDVKSCMRIGRCTGPVLPSRYLQVAVELMDEA